MLRSYNERHAQRPRQIDPDALYDGPGPWTNIRLILARRCTDEADATLRDCGYTLHDIELARWTLLGRSYNEAPSILNGKGDGGVGSPAVAAE